MPFLAGDMLRVLVGVDGEDFGVPFRGMRRGGMHREIAELPPEILVLIVGQMLVAEEDHQVFHQRVVHFLELLVAERPRQVDPANLGANMRRQLGDLDRLVRHQGSPAKQNGRMLSLRA